MLRLLASLGTLVWLALGLQWLRGIRNVPVLKELPEADRVEHYPGLSVILAARDEERSVHESVASIAAQDYPGTLEVIVVNDRSTDRTGEILEELMTRYPDRLRVLHVESLPAGWLGKTHVLYIGAARATGEWLLFTDADVIFSADCADRAVRHAIDNGLVLKRHDYKQGVAYGAGGRYFSNGITYSVSERGDDSSMNESLSVDDDGYMLFLRPMGMFIRDPSEQKLTYEGGAESYWKKLIEPLQR